MRFKRGRLPALHTRRTMRLALAMHQTLAPLGVPPKVSDDYVSAVFRQLNPSNQPLGGPWGMFLNGPDGNSDDPVIGDCTAADSAHQVMLHSANGGSIVVPPTADVAAFYSATSGWDPKNSEATDQGALEAKVCAYLMKAGLAGIKSAATYPIDPTNIAHLKWVVQIFGAVRLGILVNEESEQLFSRLEPWTAPPDQNDPTTGGHDAPGVFYDEKYLYVVTWGGGRQPKGLQPVAWELVADCGFLLEAHVDVFPDFIRAGGTAPSGFDLAGMLALAQQIEMQEAA